MEENELLEKIFIAISEPLVAGLLACPRNQNIPLYLINIERDGRFQRFNRIDLLDNGGNPIDLGPINNAHPMRNFFVQSNGRQRVRINPDGAQKIDITFQIDNNVYAVEVKCGQTGAPASPATFLSYCNKKPAYRNTNTRRISGGVASILAHLTRGRFTYNIYTDEVQPQLVDAIWYLCLRNSASWQHARAKQTSSRVFNNCRIFYVNQLADAVGEERFKQVLRQVFQSCQCETFANEMWRLATGRPDDN